MTTNLQELKQDRLSWVEATRKNRFDEGINHLLTELYPDNAHFIYELLQNAEDPKATAVRFNLSDLAVGFEHNGERLFTLKDVESITSIGNSTKRDDPTNIGKFGVGFKAVFAYTNTPEIHSGDFHLRIHDLVIPETIGVSKSSIYKRKTFFKFPFNNLKKLPETAVEEIGTGLNNLGDNTLLFLSHIRKIDYTLPNGETGSLKRIDHPKGLIEIRTQHPGGDQTISHWLHFQKEVDITDDEGKPKTCNIAIAYSLVEEVNKKTMEKTWKIEPLPHGQVSIYFPAEKETSNLRFHLHAPFASTVARDSVRDCKANHQLRDRIAELVVESLSAIRDQGMLTISFLAVLPNPADNLAAFYEPIRKAIVSEFAFTKLTPTRNGSYSQSFLLLYRSPARIAEVLDSDDLSFLIGRPKCFWVANPPPQSQREERFLDSLNLNDWGWSELVNSISSLDEGRERIETWISGKEDTWLIRFYALLGEANDMHDKCADISNLQIVRVITVDGDRHVTPAKAFFSLEDDDVALPPTDIWFVKPAVYAGGRSESQKKFAKSFLETAGVRPYDLKASVQLRLTRYEKPPKQVEDSYYEDLKLFISYFKKNPLEQNLFRNKTILLCISNENKLCWSKSEELCLDNPYFETGLAKLVTIHEKKPVWTGYQEKLSEALLRDFMDFTKAIGVMIGLKVSEAPFDKNPEYYIKLFEKHFNRTRENRTTCIEKDYSIEHLERYLKQRTISCSLLLWGALINADQQVAKALYRPNSKHQIHEKDSQLVYHLKKCAWIPNKQGVFSTPQDMSRDDLRDDFPFDNSNGLLTAIGFGENAKKRTEEYQLQTKIAKQNDFESPEEMAEAAAFAKDLKRQGKSFADVRADLSKNSNIEFPEESVPNPDLRRKGVLERSENAPSKDSVMRERSIQPGIANVLAEAKVYLRAKYTNVNSEMVCQCCQNEMPFKIGDAYYFEAVQCVKEVKNHYIENRLALCPTCAAMYQHARETDDHKIQCSIMKNNSPDKAPFVEFPITLAGKVYQLRFVGRHWFDLKTIFQNVTSK